MVDRPNGVEGAPEGNAKPPLPPSVPAVSPMPPGRPRWPSWEAIAAFLLVCVTVGATVMADRASTRAESMAASANKSAEDSAAAASESARSLRDFQAKSSEMNLVPELIEAASAIAEDARSLAQGSVTADQIQRYNPKGTDVGHLGFVAALNGQLVHDLNNESRLQSAAGRLRLTVDTSNSSEIETLVRQATETSRDMRTRGFNLVNFHEQDVAQGVQPPEICKKVARLEVTIVAFRECAAKALRSNHALRGSDFRDCRRDSIVQRAAAASSPDSDWCKVNPLDEADKPASN